MSAERFKRTTGKDSWGDFLEHAQKYGVQLYPAVFIVRPDQSAVECLALVRVDRERTLYYPVNADLPSDRRLGFAMMSRICKVLEIPEPDGWPVVI